VLLAYAQCHDRTAGYPDFWNCRDEKLGVLADARIGLAL